MEPPSKAPVAGHLFLFAFSGFFRSFVFVVFHIFTWFCGRLKDGFVLCFNIFKGIFWAILVAKAFLGWIFGDWSPPWIKRVNASWVFEVSVSLHVIRNFISWVFWGSLSFLVSMDYLFVVWLWYANKTCWCFGVDGILDAGSSWGPL